MSVAMAAAVFAGRLCFLDPQVAQQPIERLLVGVVILPAGALNIRRPAGPKGPPREGGLY